MITREDGLKIVRQHVKNANLVKHMIAVSAIMHGLAEKLGQDEELWEAVGLLHDVDYERVGNDWDRHGLISVEMVGELLPEKALHAIKAHNIRTGVNVESSMDIALLAADALSGLIVATGLMMPDKKLAQVNVKSLSGKFKDSSFARGVSRENILLSEKLGVDIDEFYSIGLSSMQKVSHEIGL